MDFEKEQVFPLLSLALCLMVWASGCASPPSPQEQAAEQIVRGSPIYARDCATELCHGMSGEGIPSEDGFRVWPLIGPEFETRNPNAQVIFDVVRSGSESNLRALSDGEIYAAIAYELDQNGVQLSAPVNEANAASVLSGDTSPPASWGSLFPPPGNARLLPPPSPPVEPPQGTAGDLRLRISQLAKASVIGKSTAPQGGFFVILVFAMQNLGDGELSLDPEFLRLVDSRGQAHSRADANLAYPMERFHSIGIQPGFGTAGYEIFLIPPGVEHHSLVYARPSEAPLEIKLR